jgi:hypothetical protein
MRRPIINIPQPCHESWEAMMPTGVGRHCAACQAEVVDFTCLTADEILAYLARPGAGGSCGRFRASQLAARPRLLTQRAAPWLAMSIAAVLTLTHCSPDAAVAPETGAATAVEDTVPMKGRVLDRDTRQPLANVLIICEADTLCQTRTAADGTFSLAVPPHLVSSKFIAALPPTRQQEAAEEARGEFLLPYIPHYFTAAQHEAVLLRRPPMVVGQTQLEPGETRTPAIAQYLVKYAALPPPPKTTIIKFIPPSSTHKQP